MEQFDVAIIGGGPGGYVAAIRAAQLGKKTILIEKEYLGGICLNWGCIPTKSLLKSAELYQKMLHAENYGISTKNVSFDLEKIISRSRDISSKLVSGIRSLIKKNKITLIEGRAKLENSEKILVDDKTTVKAKNIIIATGARARVLNGFEPNGKNIWTYKEALMPKKLPKSMIIVGSGAIGIEFACFYNALGVDITVLEAADSILPAEDKEISKMAQKSFESQGIKFKTNVKLLSKKTNDSSIEISFEHNKHKENISAEILLMAVGITGNIENIGRDKVQIKTDKGHIITNDFLQTSTNNIYAIGDVAGSPWLAHKASHEAIVAIEHIVGLKPHKIIKTNIAGCTYSTPQIASVGLTEKAAVEAGYKIKIGRFPYYANAKALIVSDHDGLVKTIFDSKTGEIIGAHMIGTDVTELIQGYVIAKGMEGTELDLINTIFPHPTLSETMHESVLQAFDHPIHI